MALLIKLLRSASLSRPLLSAMFSHGQAGRMLPACTASGLLLLASCHDKPREKAPVESFQVMDGVVILNAQGGLAGRLKVSPAVSGLYVQHVTAPATLEANPTRTAAITPPFAGRILKVFVQLGDRVQAGQPLFSMEAPDFNAAKKDYLEAQQTSALARLNLSRQQDLLAHGVGIRKELDQARSDYAVQQEAALTAANRLKVYGVNPGAVASAGSLVIKAPLAGRVIGLQLAPGQFKNDPNEVVLTVADITHLWIVADVKEKDVRFVHPGDAATATVAAYPDRVFNGKITVVDDMLDPDSRSLNVRVETPNPDRVLKPKMFATVTFADQPTTALRIPAKALLQKADSSFVFVQLAPGRFARRYVQVGETTGDQTVVHRGLKAGEQVVSDGAVYLLDAL